MKAIKNFQHSIEAFGILKVSISGIRVERIQDRVIPAVPFPHKHDFYQLMLVTHGTGTHQIDFKKYKITNGQLFIMKPGQVHSWSLSKGIKGYIIEFTRESLKIETFGETDILNQLQFLPDRPIIKNNSFLKTFLTMMEIMFDEFQNKADYHDVCLRNYLSGILVQLIRESSTFKIEHKKTVSSLEYFRQLVESHFRDQHRVEFYAKELNTSPRALTMQVSRAYGKPPRMLIQERFILEAKRYLAFSSLSIAEIGYELGFQDANYFSRFFRLHEKITPGEFRKRLKLKEGTASGD